MKRNLVFLLSIICFLACQEQQYLEIITAPSIVNKEKTLVKISRDINILSTEDAITLSNLFHNNHITSKSNCSKVVKNVIPINDDSGQTLMYAVNYDDGFMIVSATKLFYPILAIVDHGTYTNSTNSGYDVIMQELIELVQLVLSGDLTLNDTAWATYEENIIPPTNKTKVSDSYTEVVDRYISEWNAAGYNVYYLDEQPEKMPDDLYESFCDTAIDYDRVDHNYMECSFIVEYDYIQTTSIGPLCQTSWGQERPYNFAFTDPDFKLGCTTVAAAQIMKTLEYPAYINWDAMPNYVETNVNNRILSNFLANLRSNIYVDAFGGATITDANYALKFDYGYNTDNGWDLEIVNHSSAFLTPSLKKGIPILMTGSDVSSDLGHAWVCDGYRSSHFYTKYSLYVIPMGSDEIEDLENADEVDIFTQSQFFYHMNWGLYGYYNGYYLDNNIAFRHDGVSINLRNNREDLILNHE